MKEIVGKLKKIEAETALEKGKYDLFALFLREDSPNKWDVIVAANWIDANKEEALNYVAQKIQNTLTAEELSMISRIVIIAENNADLAEFHQAIHIENGTTEIKNSKLFGLQIKHAFLITSKSSHAA